MLIVNTPSSCLASMLLKSNSDDNLYLLIKGFLNEIALSVLPSMIKKLFSNVISISSFLNPGIGNWIVAPSSLDVEVVGNANCSNSLNKLTIESYELKLEILS